jgi:hydrogenase-4 component B
MVNHSLIKLALFMAAGVVFMNVHKLNLNDIKGFGRKKPLLNYIFLMGALGIGGVPLWNGYISKTLIHESIVEYTELLKEGVVTGIFSAGVMKGIEWSFLISGGLTVAYMTKLYVALFVEKNNDAALQQKYDGLKGRYMNPVSACVLTVSATLLPLMGFFPGKIMNGLADMGQGFMQVTETEGIAYFSFTNLKGALISLVIGAVVYLTVVRLWMVKKEEGGVVYLYRWKSYLDLENTIYRPLLLGLLPFLAGVVCRVLDSLVDTLVVVLRKTIYKDSPLPHELEEGTALTHILGKLANQLKKAGGKAGDEVDYEHKFALKHEELAEDRFIIRRSMSFGLLMFCVGLLITVLYLLTLK